MNFVLRVASSIFFYFRSFSSLIFHDGYEPNMRTLGHFNIYGIYLFVIPVHAFEIWVCRCKIGVNKNMSSKSFYASSAVESFCPHCFHTLGSFRCRTTKQTNNTRMVRLFFYENMLLLETLGFKENSPSLNSFQQSTF